MRKLLLATVATLSVSAGVLATQAEAQSTSAAPGTVTVRLNGRVNWYAGIEGSSLDTQADGTKTSTTNFLGYLRLYPGFDGVAANGLHYGAAAEIRINGGSSAGAETLFVHQAYGYLGLPELGQVSFGQENGPVVLLMGGEGEGLRESIKKLCDKCVAITAAPDVDRGVDSLNVSVAAGVLMQAFLGKEAAAAGSKAAGKEAVIGDIKSGSGSVAAAKEVAVGENIEAMEGMEDDPAETRDTTESESAEEEAETEAMDVEAVDPTEPAKST